MNILILTTHLNFGGIASYVVNLASGLKAKGHNVFIGSSGGDLKEELRGLGLEHIDLNIRTKSELSPKVLFSFLKLKRVIREKNIQLIHAQTRVTQALAYLLGRSLNIPYVSTCHGYFRPRLHRRIFGCWGERVIAISPAVRKHLICDFKLSPQKVEMVYNGIRIAPKHEFDRQEIKKRIGLKDAPLVGMVARLSPVKGHKYLIEAMRYIINTRSDVQLLIVGDGPSKNDLLGLIKKFGLGKNIILFSSTGNLGEIFAAMDVYASPSVQEGLGLSILEAMANYVPVAAFASGGIKDIIKHELNGLLVEPFDAKALAGAILRLIIDKDFSEAIKKTAYNYVAENFSLEMMADKTIKVYEEALK